MTRTKNNICFGLFLFALISMMAGLADRAIGQDATTLRPIEPQRPMTGQDSPLAINPYGTSDNGGARDVAQTGRRDSGYDGQELQPPPKEKGDDTFSVDEISQTGHRFFGSISRGLAKVIEYTFSRSGRPNGYILGEEAGGAFVAGLRYGEGTLYTKDAGQHKVYWQGPSIGYDFGAEGSKTMILVYNLKNVNEIYQTFGGVDGSAYFIGGVGVTFQTRGHVTLAPIRSGVGLRLGANVGYLKYTRKPTWNPF